MENEKTSSLNVRKALAGVKLLEGKPLGQALTEAGFSKWTARAPSRNGISAEQCIAEAQKLDPELNPANLTTLAAQALGERLRAMHEDGEHLRTPLLSLAKVYQITHAVSKPEPSAGLMAPGDFVATAEWLQRLLQELTERARAREGGVGASPHENS